MKDGASNPGYRRSLNILFFISVILAIAPLAFAQNATSAPTSAAVGMSPAERYGLGCLAPALVAVGLAIATRQVIVSLALGIFTASAMLCINGGQHSPLVFVTTMMDKYVLGVLAPVKGGTVDREHLTILLYTFLLGAMIGVVNANGGTRALVERVTRRVRTRTSAQIGGVFAGLLIFLDDYASAMVVGPGLRPIFDRLRISREKLAHIVNWTAAPPSSIFLSTWLAVQISWIDEGLKHAKGGAGFLAGLSGSSVFWSCIPYRTYTVLVLVALFLLALTGRDFGLMRRKESDAAGLKTETPKTESQNPAAEGWWLAVLPAIVLIVLMFGLMFWTGFEACRASGTSLSFSAGSMLSSLGVVLGKANSHFALLYSSLAGAVLAIVLTVASRALTLTKTMESAMSGMFHTFTAALILIMAWGLSQASKDLQLGQVAREFLSARIASGTFSVAWLPLSTFVTACILSFSMGTSWGTMAILVPMVVEISGGLLSSVAPGQALPLFYATVGGTMAGAIFGNTCSPLADVTVLSAMFSECDIGSHVRTVFPYAIWVAITSVLCTDGIRLALEKFAPQFYASSWNVWYGLATGTILLLIFVFLVCRRPRGVVIEPAVLFETASPPGVTPAG